MKSLAYFLRKEAFILAKLDLDVCSEDGPMHESDGEETEVYDFACRPGDKRRRTRQRVIPLPVGTKRTSWNCQTNSNV